MNEPVTNDLANSTDNVFTPGTEKTITIKAFLTPEGDEKTEITSVVTSWKINLFENGDPQEGTFWSANRNVVTFELNGDVTLDFLFAGIGDSGYDISGIIDGKGHTAGETGGIVGENYGTITNCVKLRRRVKLIPNFEFKIPNT